MVCVVTQQYNIYSKTATFFEKVVENVPGASRRASGLVQYSQNYSPTGLLQGDMQEKQRTQPEVAGLSSFEDGTER